MAVTIGVPSGDLELKPKLVVIGAGGAGGNAVNNMIQAGLKGVDFIVANTDAQALKHSLAEKRLQLGATLTRGLGAGGNPQIGRDAALESEEDIRDCIAGANMVFIAAGMGGGTGTGSAAIIAEICRREGVLTVGVVTRPFLFEGKKRARSADLGIEELQRNVDTLIVIPNHNLFRVANHQTTMAEAFRMADEVLHTGVRGITDLMVMPGLINLDFADVRTVMKEMGKAMMGTGEAEGEDRALRAAESAISNPLLEDSSMKGARSLLVNITGGSDLTLLEVQEAAERIGKELDSEAEIIFGSALDTTLEGKVRITVIATGIDAEEHIRHVNQNQDMPNSRSNPTTAAPVQTRSSAEMGRSPSLSASANQASSPQPQSTMGYAEQSTERSEIRRPSLREELLADTNSASPAPTAANSREMMSANPPQNYQTEAIAEDGDNEDTSLARLRNEIRAAVQDTSLVPSPLAQRQEGGYVMPQAAVPDGGNKKPSWLPSFAAGFSRMRSDDTKDAHTDNPIEPNLRSSMPRAASAIPSQPAPLRQSPSSQNHGHSLNEAHDPYTNAALHTPMGGNLGGNRAYDEGSPALNVAGYGMRTIPQAQPTQPQPQFEFGEGAVEENNLSIPAFLRRQAS